MIVSKAASTVFLATTLFLFTFTVRVQTGEPVEKNKPNSSYQPAFAGQTRTASVKTKTPYAVTDFSTELKSARGMHVLPDGRLLISSKSGTMQIVNTNGKILKKITGFPPVQYESQGGLLDVNIDPGFLNNRLVYWTYTQPGEGGAALAVAKGRLSADKSKLESVQVIWEALPRYKGAEQFGSRIMFDRQGNLFVTSGDRQANDIGVKAQDLNATTGKIIHITREGKPVASNPFIGKAT
jgi:glucose/arabinose dehydrogenase